LRSKSGKTGAANLLLLLSHNPALQQKFAMPCHAHASIVLPDFSRSCAADEKTVCDVEFPIITNLSDANEKNGDTVLSVSGVFTYIQTSALE